MRLSDKDGDGELSIDEFRSFLDERFEFDESGQPVIQDLEAAKKQAKILMKSRQRRGKKVKEDVHHLPRLHKKPAASPRKVESLKCEKCNIPVLEG